MGFAHGMHGFCTWASRKAWYLHGFCTWDACVYKGARGASTPAPSHLILLPPIPSFLPCLSYACPASCLTLLPPFPPFFSHPHSRDVDCLLLPSSQCNPQGVHLPSSCLGSCPQLFKDELAWAAPQRAALETAHLHGAVGAVVSGSCERRLSAG